MALLASNLPRLALDSSRSTQKVSPSAFRSHKPGRNASTSTTNHSGLLLPRGRARDVRWYSQNSNENKQSVPSDPKPESQHQKPPNMTTFPKAMKRIMTDQKANTDMGEIAIGPDGVVVPPKKAAAAASSGFSARKAVSSQEEILKRMYEIDKKIQDTQRAKAKEQPETRTSTASRRGSLPLFPEMVIFDYHPRKWVHLLNAVACLGSFPIHAWGFYALQPHLVAPLFAGSLVWLWWHNRVMSTTLTRVVLLPGHEQVALTNLNFFGMAKTRTVSVHSLTSVLGRRSEAATVTPDQAAGALGTTLATTEVLYLDVDELLVNARNADEANEMKSKNDTPYRTRYVVQQPLAKTFRQERFLKFTAAPTNDPTARTKNMFGEE